MAAAVIIMSTTFIAHAAHSPSSRRLSIMLSEMRPAENISFFDDALFDCEMMPGARCLKTSIFLRFLLLVGASKSFTTRHRHRATSTGISYRHQAAIIVAGICVPDK